MTGVQTCALPLYIWGTGCRVVMVTRRKLTPSSFHSGCLNRLLSFPLFPLSLSLSLSLSPCSPPLSHCPFSPLSLRRSLSLLSLSLHLSHSLFPTLTVFSNFVYPFFSPFLSTQALSLFLSLPLLSLLPYPYPLTISSAFHHFSFFPSLSLNLSPPFSIILSFELPFWLLLSAPDHNDLTPK